MHEAVMRDGGFPGHEDAGKVQAWISCEISSTSLGKDLISVLATECGDQKSHQNMTYQQASN